jgi:hypothetical protein
MTLLLVTLVLLFATGATLWLLRSRLGSVGAKKLSFNQTIQPILSENCYACHGPDPGARKAGLRLDRTEFAFASHEKYGPAILPGRPDKSPLVQRIESTDSKERMPPPEAHRTLKPQEIALLREWVKEGAPYEEHWSFIVPTRPAIPTANNNLHWARNPVDSFILSRMEKEGLKPSEEADRSTLIRRVTYDLTGLPPTPDEVTAFLTDHSENAFEKVVDRLLASPRYGEHRAHYWLDVARYGDTHGLHLDNLRSIWPYRDYVIKSYNQNKPFDQFVKEQIAGDLLPARNLDSIVASAFLRAGISSGEGGALIEELRVNNKRERTEAFGAAFLGLTTGCAVCHDHKFDPITRTDFYQLTAFFNNLTENPSNDDREDWPPFIRVPKESNRAAYEQILAKRTAIENQIAQQRARARELIAVWVKDSNTRLQPVSTSGLQVRLRFDEQNGVTFVNSARVAKPEHVVATESPVIWGEGIWLWPFMRMDTTTRLDLPDAGDLERNQQFSVAFWLRPDLRPLESKDKKQPSGVILGRADSRQGSRGWQLRINQRKLTFTLAHDHHMAATIETKENVLIEGRWNHVLATYSGSGNTAGMKLYLDGQPQEVKTVKDKLEGTMRTSAPMTFGRLAPDADPLRQSAFQDFRLYNRELQPDEAARVPYEDYVSEIVQKPLPAWSEDEFKVASDFYFAQRDGVTRALTSQLPSLDNELDKLSKDGDVSVVSEEGAGIEYADVLTRGVYNARTQRVSPAVPHFLPPLPPGVSPNRLALADWTVNPKNPLTVRVTVNRMWQEIFGTGIVETTEDFGVMGTRPSHPELLDWLAVDFRDSGWNVKRFYKQLVLSSTYRQSARVTPQLAGKDPKNRLLARGPRFRMDSEMVRDTVLAASGLMVEKLGGPSVKPYQPPGIWDGSHDASNTRKYAQDHGEALYRRSLYTFWKRMATMPDMDTFDSPMRDAACTRRQRTDTPLQALVQMNETLRLEASRKLAERVVHQSLDLDSRLSFLGKVLLAREWTSQEKSVLESAVAKFQATYAKDPGSAARLLRVGESRVDETVPAPELAVWMLVSSAALNLDAVVNK